MPTIDTYVRLTPVSGGTALNLNGADDISRDQIGNITFSWRDPLKDVATTARLVLADVEPYLSKGVEQKKNRDAAYLVVTDNGGSLQTVEWTEVDPWTGETVGPYTLVGVVALTGYRSSRKENGLTLVAYLADFRYSRGTGTYEAAP